MRAEPLSHGGTVGSRTRDEAAPSASPSRLRRRPLIRRPGADVAARTTALAALAATARSECWALGDLADETPLIARNADPEHGVAEHWGVFSRHRSRPERLAVTGPSGRLRLHAVVSPPPSCDQLLGVRRGSAEEFIAQIGAGDRLLVRRDERDVPVRALRAKGLTVEVLADGEQRGHRVRAHNVTRLLDDDLLRARGS